MTAASCTPPNHGSGSGAAGQSPTAGWTSHIEPWSKAGIIITASTKPGSAYAAMMVTGRHGARMQWDYTGDTATSDGTVTVAAPRWLRLTRHSDTITGYDSADGSSWTKVGTVTLNGLPATAQTGLFAASPDHGVTLSQSAIGKSSGIIATQDTGAFDHLSLGGTWPGGGWTGSDVGDTNGPTGLDSFRRIGGGFTVSGSGDIAPFVANQLGAGARIEDAISVGSFAAVIAAGVLGALFITAEYRRGLIRVTLAASPRRGRILAAKAIVIGVTGRALGEHGGEDTSPLIEIVMNFSRRLILMRAQDPAHVLSQASLWAALARPVPSRTPALPEALGGHVGSRC